MAKGRKVGIVGTGNVGVASAYAIFQQRLANEIVLVDKDEKRAEGEALDLMHGQVFVARTVVRAGGYESLAGAHVVVVCAGVGQRPGESRLDLLARNAEVFRAIALELDTHAPDALVLVATNPVDVLTYALQTLSQRPRHRIVGTGTTLDSARFRACLGEHYGTDPRSVHAYILGEHGDSEVPIWSTASIGGVSIVDHEVLGKRFEREAMDRLFVDVRDAAKRIIERKGYTHLAIGSVIAHLVDVVLADRRTVLPLSVRLTGQYGIDDVCLSLPVVLGQDGVGEPMTPPLDESEIAALRRSADVLSGTLAALTRERGGRAGAPTPSRAG